MNKNIIKKHYFKGTSNRYSETKDKNIYDFIEKSSNKPITHKEKVYCYIHNLTPSCVMCSNIPKFKNFHEGYNDYCSVSCSVKANKEKQEKTRKQNINKMFASLSVNEILLGLDNKTYNVQKWRDIEKLSEFYKFKTLSQAIEHFKYNNQICTCGKVLDIDRKCLKCTINKNKEILKEKEIKRTKRIQNKKNGIKEYRVKNSEYITKEYILSNFIKDDSLLINKFLEFFNCKESFMYSIIKHFNISYKKSKHQTQNVVALTVKNPILDTRSVITPFELDVYSKEHNFAVEYNGIMFHSEGEYNKGCITNKDKNYHLKKTELCEEKNIQLYHIFENEWIDSKKKQIWFSIIRGKQGLHKKIGARKCTIKEVSIKDSKEFLEENHMQGSINSSIRIGLYYNNILVSLMTFGKARFSDYEYELLRFASKKHITVQGGGSKLLKYFELLYKPKSLISYANRRWSQGNFYEQVGFTFSHNSKPNYFYFKQNSMLLESRNKYQKHKLKNILDVFDINKTEKENMFNNGYRRIFDSGNKIYIKEYK